MKSILLKLSTALLVVLLAAACCHCRSFQKKTRQPLVGTEWQLIQLGGQSITPTDGQFTLTFDAENHLTGIGSCNRLMGDYTLGEKNALTFGAVASTRMACPDMEREMAFMQLFEQVTRYDMDGPMLLLLDAKDNLLAVFQAKPAGAPNPEAQARTSAQVAPAATR